MKCTKFVQNQTPAYLAPVVGQPPGDVLRQLPLVRVGPVGGDARPDERAQRVEARLPDEPVGVAEAHASQVEEALVEEGLEGRAAALDHTPQALDARLQVAPSRSVVEDALGGPAPTAAAGRGGVFGHAHLQGGNWFGSL